MDSDVFLRYSILIWADHFNMKFIEEVETRDMPDGILPANIIEKLETHISNDDWNSTFVVTLGASFTIEDKVLTVTKNFDYFLQR